MTGTEVLCRTLRRLGVRYVFGMPGSQNADFYAQLPDHGLRPILATQETSAAFMANGYARASRDVAVLATIPGPGFTYALPGLAEARLDSAAVLHITGTPATGGGRRFQHQRIDQAAIATPLVKDIVEVRGADEMAGAVERAHRTALAGEPGPVLLHVDSTAMQEEVSADEVRREEATRSEGGGRSREVPWRDRLLDRLRSSRRPVVFVGAGSGGAAASVVELVERLRAPAFSTVSGRGIVPEDHRNALGFDPDRGRLQELNELLDTADRILALGCKLSHNGTAGFRLRLPQEKLVHVNTDPEALGPNYPAETAIQARVEEVIPAALEELSEGGSSDWTDAEIAEWKERISDPRTPSDEPRIQGVDGGRPRAFFQALRESLPRESTVATDAGLHQVLTRRYFPVWTAGGLLTPTDFQSMGFGVPAAVGAKLAEPSRPVVAVVGDGAFLISATDLAAAVREEVPVVVVVFHDGFLNLIRLQQIRDHGRPSAVDLLTPDLEVFAEALGIRYRRIEGRPAETLRAAVEDGRPTLVEVRLRDSSGIRKQRRRGRAKHLVRRTLGRRVIERIKSMLRG